MLIGLSTVVFWDYNELDLPGAIAHAVEDLGFEAVEIACEDPVFRGWGTEEAERTKARVKDVLSTLDTGVALHAPFHDLNMATLNEGVRRGVIRQHRECIETARSLGSDTVTVHPGYVSSRKYRKEDAFRQMVRNLEEIVDMARDHDVQICLENLAVKRKAMGVKIPEIERILKEVNRGSLKLTLDVAHANTTERGPIEYARRLKEHVAHVHASDNAGEDNHLSIGEGNVDFEGVLRELQPYDGIVTVEGWIPTDEDPFLTHDREVLERVREKLGPEDPQARLKDGWGPKSAGNDRLS